MSADERSVTAVGSAPDRRGAADLPTWWSVVIGVVATAVAFAGSWIPSIWSDEAATISASTRTWSQLWTLVGHVDIVHAAYYSLMHIWFGLFGVSAVLLRLPSALAVGVAAVGVAQLGRYAGGRTVALLAATVFIVLPRVTWMGIEGRSSALTAAGAAWLTVLFVRACRSGTRRTWACYGLAVAVLTQLWLYMLLLVLSHAVGFLFFRAERVVVKRFLVASVVGTVLSLPLVIEAKRQSDQVGWIHRPGLSVVKDFGVGQWFGTDGLIDLPLALCCWALIAALLWRTFRGRRRVVDAKQPPAVALMTSCILLPPLALILASFLVTPLYTPKYAAFCVPAVAVLLGCALARLADRRLLALALTTIVVLSLPSYVDERRSAAKDGSDWKEVAAVVAAHKRLDDGIVFGNLDNSSGKSRGTARSIFIAYPAQFGGVVDLEARDHPPKAITVFGNSLPLADQASSVKTVDRLWVLYDRGLEFDTSADRTALVGFGFSVLDSWNLPRTQVVLLTRG